MNFFKMMAKHAETFPNAIALQDAKKVITYSQLHYLIEQTSYELQNQYQVSVNDRIAIMSEPSINAVILMLAIIYSGATYVPIDPRYPMERRQLILKDSDCRLLVADESLEGDYIDLTQLINTASQAPSAPPCYDQNQYAYIIYTSGTTGKPKGVPISLNNVNALLRQTNDELDFSAEDRWLLHHSLAFDFSVWELFASLYHASCCVIYSPGQDQWNLSDFYNFCFQYKISLLNITPSLFYNLSQHILSNNLPHHFKFIIFGGEKLNYSSLMAWNQRYANTTKLYNTFGATEISVIVSLYLITTDDLNVGNSIIGEPFRQSTFAIFDDETNSITNNKFGELLVSGPGVFSGYLTNDKALSEIFYCDKVNNVQYYRTGDYVKHDSKGNIVYCYRKDTQIKLRGYRVDTSEIDAILLEHPNITFSITLCQDDNLINFYQSTEVIPADELKKTLIAKLPNYAIPSQFIEKNTLPLTRHGKVNREKLLEQIITQHSTQLGSTVAEQLLQLWAKQLNTVNFSKEMSFFKLGGHSLSAIRLVNAINKKWQLNCRIDFVFKHRTFESQYVELLKLQKITQILIDDKHATQNTFPVPAPVRLWKKLQQAMPNNSFTIPLVLKLHGEHNLQRWQIALKRALEDVIFHCKIINGDNNETLIITDDAPLNINIPIIDAPEWGALLQQHRHLKISLNSSPLFKIAVCQLASDVIATSLVFHHAIMDEWSLQLLQKRIFLYYQDKPVQITNSYYDFCLYQLQKKSDASFLSQLEHYLTQLKKCQKIPNNFNSQYWLASTQEPIEISRSIPQSVVNLYSELAEKSESSLNTVLVHHVIKAIFQQTRSQRFTVGIISHGRPDTFYDTLGCFMSPQLLPIDYDSTLSVNEQIQQLHNTLLENLAHPDVSTEYLNELYPEYCFTACVLIHINHTSNHLAKSELEISCEANNNKQSLKYPFEVSFNINNHTIDVIIKANQAYFAEFSLDRFNKDLQYFQTDEHSMVARVTGQTIALPDDLYFYQSLNNMFIQYHDCVAIETPEQVYSFSQLATRVYNIVRDIQTYLPEPNNTILVDHNFSVNSIAAVFASIISGNILVPLDHNLPSSRLQHVINNSDATLLLTHQPDKINLPIRKINLSLYTDRVCSDHVKTLVNTTADYLYYYFTSGSTGEPKRACGTIRALQNRFLWMDRNYPLEKEEKIAQKTSLSFIDSLWEIIHPLLQGIPIYLFPKNAAYEPDIFINTLCKNNITRVFLLPSHLLQLYKQAQSQQKLQSLKYIFTSGEHLSVELVRQHQQLLPSTKLINLYGSTEVADITYYEIDSTKHYDVIPVGMPLANTTITLCDEQQHSLLRQQQGTLVVKGPMTGGEPVDMHDIGYMDHKGNSYVIGRSDRIVKCRGFRIALDAVEYCAQQCPGIEQVCCFLDQSAQLLKLVYYGACQKVQLEHYLHTQLASYQQPLVMSAIEPLPTLYNGKLDRISIEEHDDYHPKMAAIGNSSLITQTQSLVIGAFAEIFSQQPITLVSDFFQLGGHSLRAMELVTVLSKKFNISLPVSILLNHATPQQLADYIDNNNDIQESLPDVIAQTYSDSQYFPFTALQQAYLIGRESGVKEGGIGITVFVEYQLTHLDINRLERAWNDLIQRHDALRLQVINYEQQCVIPAKTYNFENRTLSSHTPAMIREEFKNCNFDPKTWPMFKIAYYHEKESTILFFAMDMLIADGLSLAILLHEWQQLYHNQSLPKLSYHFRDYLHWLEQYQCHESYTTHENYWLNLLENNDAAPELSQSLSTTNERAMDRVTFSLPKTTWQIIKQRASTLHVSTTGWILTYFGLLLDQYCINNNFIINLTTFSRSSVVANMGNVVGDFTNILFFSYQQSVATISEQLTANQRQLWQSLAHSHVSGITALQKHNERQQKHVLFPVVLTSLLGLKHSSPDKNIFEKRFSYSQTPQVWCDCKVYEKQQQLVVEIDFAQHRLNRTMMQCFAEQFSETLTMSASIDLKTRFQVGLAKTQKQLYQNYNSPVTAPSKSIIDWLNIEKYQYADTIALCCLNESITYRDFYQRVYHLSGYIQEYCNTDGIAILLPKSCEQVIVACAIILAGKFYVPLDLMTPHLRLSKQLDTINIDTIITSQETKQKYNPFMPAMTFLSLEHVASHKTLAYKTLQNDLSEQLAYIIFTSGSTGTPKGVAMTHAGVVNTLVAMQQLVNLNNTDTLLAISKLNFDLSVYDIFASLAVGATCVIPDESQMHALDQWQQLFIQHKITIWNSVPSLFDLLINDSDNAILSSLRCILLSGDVVSPHLIQLIQHDLPTVLCYALGGATEAGIWSIVHKIDPNTSYHKVPYGQPLLNQTIYVLDDSFCQKPIGVLGEIVIGGGSLASSYYNDVDKTAQSFRTHPLSGERLYFTGDLGYYNLEGEVTIVGRKDLQVKVAGNRIELSEIENILFSHPGIKNAVACVPTQHRDRIIAFLLIDSLLQFDYQDKKIKKLCAKLQYFNMKENGMVHWRLPTSSAWKNYITKRQSHYHFSWNNNADIFFKCFDHLSNHQQHSTTLSLTELLAPLCACYESIYSLPKFRYPSGGNLYPVKLILNLAAGNDFYLDPLTATLRSAKSQTKLPDYYQLGKGDSITFNYDDSLINILYGEKLAYRLALLEAGYLLAVIDKEINLFNHFDMHFFKDQNNNLLRMQYGQSVRNVLPPIQFTLYHQPANAIYHYDTINKNWQLTTTSALDFSDEKTNKELLVAGEFLLIITSDTPNANATLIQAGLQCGLLLENSFDYQLGFTPIGTLSKEILQALNLNELEFVHALVGGVPLDHKQDITDYKALLLNVISNQMKHYCQQYLPNTMIPAYFGILDHFPLSTNGKIDRGQLAATPIPDNICEQQLPRTPLEYQLQQFYQDILQQEYTNIHDSFFSSGGSSLLAIRLLNKINQCFSQANVTMSTIYEHSSVASLAQILSQQLPTTKTPLVVSPMPNDKPTVLCLPPGGGLSLCYLSLCAELTEFNVVLINDPHFATGHGFTCLEEFAHYIITHKQWSEVTAIIGWSFGGVLGFELAQQLTQIQKQPLLIMLDSHYLYNRPFQPVDKDYVAAYLNQHIDDPVMNNDIKQAMNRNLQLMHGYQATSNSFPIIFIDANNDHRYSLANNQTHEGWPSCCYFSDVITLEGDHNALFEGPNLTNTLKTLRQCLDGICVE